MRLALLSVVAAVVLAGCGVTPDITIPTFPKFPEATGDQATFVIDDRPITVRQSGSIEVTSVPQLTYSGPLGCRGHYFTGHFTEHIQMLFRYSSHDAWLLIGQDLYHFEQPPMRRHGQLAWSHRFDDRHIAVLVNCRGGDR